MQGSTIALYWDPAVKNNGALFCNDKGNLKHPFPAANGEAPSTQPVQNVNQPDSVLRPHDTPHEKEKLLQQETATIQENISAILTNYDTLHVFSSSKDFILQVYDIGHKFLSEEQTPTNSSTPITKPVLLVMVPSSSFENLALVRFMGYVGFYIPSLPIVLSSDKVLHSFASCGVSHMFPPTLNKETVAIIEQKSHVLTQEVIQEYRQRKEKALAASALNQPQSLLGKSHVQYFLSALEHIHETNILFEDQSLIDASNLEDGPIPESTYPEVFHITQAEVTKVQKLIGEWNFYVHDLDENELLFAVYAMLKHGLALPGVEELWLSDVGLLKFLLLVRDSYRPSNPYHNFRHAIDVVQASFYFLLQLKSLPEYPLTSNSSYDSAKSILSPVEALTVLIVATGHDVGHPGVTNAFILNSNCPLGTLFENKSVLEYFHSVAFTEILKTYWPSTQQVPVCKLIVTSVLATDMARHFDYMEEISKVSKNCLNASDLKASLEYRTLICCILVKCADISNVARKLDISTQWGIVLGKEFAEVEALEVALGMKPPTAAATAEITETKKAEKSQLALAKGQIFFITTFAKPLFSAVSQMLPELSYTMSTLDENLAYWVSQLPPQA